MTNHQVKKAVDTQLFLPCSPAMKFSAVNGERWKTVVWFLEGFFWSRIIL